MSMSKLPLDLVEEILCRVPATSLKRLRSTCKTWNRLFTDDKRFARKHFDKAAKQILPVLLTRESRIFPIGFNYLHGIVEFKGEFGPRPNNVDISQVVHCDGLLLCTYHKRSRVVVWNPLTGKTRWVDNGNFFKSPPTFVFGYIQGKNKSSSKSYKILSFYLGSMDSQIYEFESDSWRMLDDDVSPAWFTYSCWNSVFLKGKAYWFAIYIPKTYPVSLIGFDFSTEEAGRVPLPYQCDSYACVNLTLVREEKLSVLLQKEATSKTEIWVTNKIDEGTKVMSWTKVLELDLSPDLQVSSLGNFLLDEGKNSLVFCERWMDPDVEFDDILAYNNKCKDMIYIVGEDNKVTPVDITVDVSPCGYWPAILNYVPSLIQIEQGKEVTKEALHVSEEEGEIGGQVQS